MGVLACVGRIVVFGSVGGRQSEKVLWEEERVCDIKNFVVGSSHDVPTTCALIIDFISSLIFNLHLIIHLLLVVVFLKSVSTPQTLR